MTNRRLLVALSGAVVWMTMPDVGVLKSAYPIVHYEGPDRPPGVSIQRGRPVGWTTVAEGSAPSSRKWVISNKLREVRPPNWLGCS